MTSQERNFLFSRAYGRGRQAYDRFVQLTNAGRILSKEWNKALFWLRVWHTAADEYIKERREYGHWDKPRQAKSCVKFYLESHHPHETIIEEIYRRLSRRGLCDVHYEPLFAFEDAFHLVIYLNDCLDLDLARGTISGCMRDNLLTFIEEKED